MANSKDNKFDLSGDFGKAILHWEETGQRAAWRAGVEEQKNKFNFDENPHPFVSFHEPTKPKTEPKPGARVYKGVNLKLHFTPKGGEPLVGNKVTGYVISNNSKELTTRTEADGKESEMLPQFGFTKHQRDLKGQKLDEVLALPLAERDAAAPRDPRAAIYVDASFILREDIALMASHHPLCVHKFTNVTNGIQTQFESEDPTTHRTVINDMHEEARICRLKLLFAKKGFHEPTVFEDLQKSLGQNKFGTAQVNDEDITKYNVHNWITGGSKHVITEYWSSVDLTTMGRNLQVYVLKLTSLHRERSEFDIQAPEDLMAFATASVTNDKAAEALAAH